ncbi:MAG: AAA family ATPase, partial [Candidatus Ancillula sp.]|nr:AAA family ATPase [Candidatus Ancillula sp.]
MNLAKCVIIGMPGSGKTRLGKALCEELGLNISDYFVDTDLLIEKKEKRTINEIFLKSGEEYFRKQETNILQQCLESDVIVSTGGGLPISEDNQVLINEYRAEGGKVIYLDVPNQVAIERVEKKNTRPLLKDDAKKNWLQTKGERENVYKYLADISIWLPEAEDMAKQIKSLIDSEKIQVGKSYSVFVGDVTLEPFMFDRNVSKIYIFLTESVKIHFSNLVKNIENRNGLQIFSKVIPDAEEGKTFSVYEECLEELALNKFSRSD